MASCPECGSSYVRRIPRTPLMRILWSSKHILCSDCGERSIVFPELMKVAEKHRASSRTARFILNRLQSQQSH
jgi:hypothetical protein